MADPRKKVIAARRLRCDATNVEQVLWWHLANRQMDRLKFRRQHPIGLYVADFACPAAKLIVELDGDQHAQQRAYDDARSAYLATRGYRVVRFGNREINDNIEGVLDAIWRAAKACLK